MPANSAIGAADRHPSSRREIAASLCTRFGIPAILGELMVGVLAGPGASTSCICAFSQALPAADCFLLLAQIGGLVLMFIAGLETDIERMREASATAFPGGVVRRHLAVLPGSGRSAPARPALEQRAAFWAAH